jgi:PKD repeat protein
LYPQRSRRPALARRTPSLELLEQRELLAGGLLANWFHWIASHDQPSPSHKGPVAHHRHHHVSSPGKHAQHRPGGHAIHHHRLVQLGGSVERHFDFGGPLTPIATGYLGVTGLAYTSTLGYGWANLSGLSWADRGNPNALKQDLHWGQKGTFLVDLPNGTYNVTVTLGDDLVMHDNMSLWLEGTQVAQGLTTAAGQFIQPTFTVNVTGGQLSLRIQDQGGRDKNFAIDGLDITSASTATPPVANAGATVAGNEGSSVNFAGSVVGGAVPLAYAWNFGDGTTASGTLTPSHVYADNGNYSVTLTVTDLLGQTSVATTAASISNVPPTATITGAPSSGHSPEGTAISLGSTVTDPSSADTAAGFTYAWSVTKNGGAFATGTGTTLIFTPDDNGTYVTNLTAKDKDGGTSPVSSSTILVDNVVPTATITGAPSSGTPGSVITVGSTVTDPSSVDTAAGFSYAWSVTKNGSPFASGSTASLSFTPDAAATYVVTLTAKDKDGGSSAPASSTIVVGSTSGTSAVFLGTDTTAQGNWQGVFGSQGYNIIGASASYPPYAQVSPAGQSEYVWNASTSDPRGLLKPGSSDRILACWYATSNFSVNVTIGDGQTHQVALYLLDSDNQGRSEKVQVLNAATGAVLNTQNATNFGSGVYYAWNISGSVTFSITRTGGPNAVISGLFFDPPGTPHNPPPLVTITGTPSSGHAPEGAAVTLSENVQGDGGYTYAWSVTKNGSPFASGTDANFTFIPDDNGSYVTTLTVIDQNGQSGTASATIIADNVTPTAVIYGAPPHANPGTVISMTSAIADPSSVDMAAGFTYAWSVTKDGALFVSGNTAGFTFTPDTTATYVVTLKATDKDGGIGTKQATIVVDNNPDPLILLPSSTLAALRQQALNNTAQWQAFKSRLDQNLAVFLNYGDYQASELSWISDYALGYQVLKDSDPVTAANYADKALALMKSGLHDFQKAGWETRQFLSRGNGVTSSFTLPNNDLLPSTVHVYLANVTTQAVVHGPANTPDSVSYYQRFLKVSNTPDGGADYAEGADWQHNASLPNNLIDWSPSGKEPATGATYYVTLTSPFGASSASFSLSGNTITLSTPPSSSQAVFVEYIYGTHSTNGSTLAYQQTSAGDGGFNNIMIDTTYTSRYLGKYLAIGLDWLDGYVGFSAGLKSEVESMLVRWSDFVRDNGYLSNAPASNYGAGGYVSRVMTALALANRDSVNGPRLISEVLAYRQDNVLPALQNSTNSLAGGFWAEGWNYGQLATQNLLLAGIALEEEGQISAATAERQWASQVVENLLSAQPSSGTIFNGGDWFAYPAPFPEKELLAVLSSTASVTADRAYANYVLQNYPGTNSNDSIDLIFRNPSASASFWSSLPLQDFASGTGTLVARSDWGSSPTWVATQFSNLLVADHQTYSPGLLQIQRGADDLLINGNAPGNNQASARKSTFSNTLVVDDNGEGAQTYRYSMGTWYGAPGVTVNAYEATGSYTYIYGDYHAAYSTNTNPGGGGSTSELTRQVVYLRPDYVVVYDRVTTIKDYYTKQLRWHFLNAPTVSGNSWVESVGSSKLFGQTFSTAPLATTVAPVQVGNATIQEVITQNTAATPSVRYVTAFQVASSTTTAMVSTQSIISTDSRMEGVQMGSQLVLFGRNGDVDLSTPVTYQINSTSAIQHLLVNLKPGQSYKVFVNGTLTATLTASSQGTLSFTTSTVGAQTIQVSR